VIYLVYYYGVPYPPGDDTRDSSAYLSNMHVPHHAPYAHARRCTGDPHGRYARPPNVVTGGRVRLALTTNHFARSRSMYWTLYGLDGTHRLYGAFSFSRTIASTYNASTRAPRRVPVAGGRRGISPPLHATAATLTAGIISFDADVPAAGWDSVTKADHALQPTFPAPLQPPSYLVRFADSTAALTHTRCICCRTSFFRHEPRFAPHTTRFHTMPHSQRSTPAGRCRRWPAI